MKTCRVRGKQETFMAANARFLNPSTLAKPPGYSYVVDTGPGRTIYIAGQLGLDMDNKLLGTPGDFRSQCTGAFENLGKALAAVGAGFSDLVKINNYLVDMSHVGIFREVRDKFLNAAAPPASTTVAISQLARPGALFEIEGIAVLPAKAAAASRAKSKGAKSTTAKSKGARRSGGAAKAKAAKRKRR
jgi:enamine deaminase RidA (YjgF/YER057c/UK114 family)